MELPPSGQPVPVAPMYRWNSQNSGSVSPMNRVFDVPSATSASLTVRAAAFRSGVQVAAGEVWATRANIPGNSLSLSMLEPQVRLGPYPGCVGGLRAGGMFPAVAGPTWPLQWIWNGAGQPEAGLLHCGPTLAT